MEELPGVIRSIRNRLSLSQAEMGTLVKCSQNTISRYEQGNSSPSARRLRKLLDLTTNEEERRAILAQLEEKGAIIFSGSAEAAIK